MIYEPREITCRDGRSCILRSAAVTDANDLIRYLKVTAGETPFLIREPDEISLTPEQEEHFIRNRKRTAGTDVDRNRCWRTCRQLFPAVSGKL